MNFPTLITLSGTDAIVVGHGTEKLPDNIELGILLSLKHLFNPEETHPRYSYWSRLHSLFQTPNRHHRLSGHFCGKLTRIALGLAEPSDDIEQANLVLLRKCLLKHFDRVQLNGSTYWGDHEPEALLRHFPELKDKTVILQIKHSSQLDIAHEYARLGLRVTILFDASGGKGETPKSWPVAWNDFPCGYAGGLTPENVVDQLKSIRYACSGSPDSWIDVESGIRDQNDQLDLEKVSRFLTNVNTHCQGS